MVTPYLEAQYPLDEERNSTEVEKFLHLVADKYSNVPAIDWKLTGPGKILVEVTPYSKAKSYGDLARALSFELNNIAPGKLAPEIEGTDAEGQQFRLSDYNGKVVLLVFSANWCGGCVALHPMERKLVEKYRDRSFVLLGVSRDEKVDTLKADTASGEITWRCWWDGMYGPIREAWNAESAPRIILLDDKHCFQNVTFDRLTTQDEYERAIDSLLKNVEASSPSAPK